MDVRELRHIIGRRLKELRVSRGWTQGQVAGPASITRDFLGRAERGLREPSLYVLCKLAKVFGVHPSALVSPIDPQDQPLTRQVEALLLSRPQEEVRWLLEVLTLLVARPEPGVPQPEPRRPSILKGKNVTKKPRGRRKC